jgi:hypothetical protein
MNLIVKIISISYIHFVLHIRLHIFNLLVVCACVCAMHIPTLTWVIFSLSVCTKDKKPKAKGVCLLTSSLINQQEVFTINCYRNIPGIKRLLNFFNNPVRLVKHELPLQIQHT